MYVELDRQALDEELLVRLWRYEQFTALGFSEIESSILARSADIDLALVRDMREAGCPTELVLQIVF